MAAIINGLRSLRILPQKDVRRILIFGNDAAGKTSLLYRLKLGEMIQAIPTIGFNVETIKHNKSEYELWDVGGCNKFQPLWYHYVDKASHVLYVHSLVDDRVDESLKGAGAAAQLMTDAGARFMWIVFNKQDLLSPEKRDATIADHKERFERVMQSHAAKLKWQIIDLPGFSVHTGERITEIFNVFQDSINNLGEKAVPPPPSTPASVHDSPTEDELVARIHREASHDLDSDTFWKAFLAAEIQEWNHRCHLRAGYMVLLDALRSGNGIFECAETFLEHLHRFKEANSERFRNTEHRTMTIFWLYHLQLAILSYKTDNNLTKWPDAVLFNDILLHSPFLMYGGLWKDYYTKDLMMSPEAKEYWRLPDLQALPDFAQAIGGQRRHVRRNSQEEPYRLMRFAFAVVQKYLSSNVRRGWLVKQALASLQSTTMRLRAENPSMPPYSETQAYFWIQLVHAALASVHQAGGAEKPLQVPISRLSFSSFRVLFDLDPTLWKTYYSPKIWDGIEARMSFVPPDLKPLPNVISVPSTRNVFLALDKQIDSARLGMAAELPSMEDLALRASLLLEDVKSVTDPTSPDIESHAQQLLYLFNALTGQTGNSVIPLATRATTAMMHLKGSYAQNLTIKAFWTQQVLGASSRVADSSESSPLTFEDFIRANLHLVYEDLPLCYYSPESLQSLEAKETIIQPDRRRLRGFLSIEGSTPNEDDWVVL